MRFSYQFTSTHRDLLDADESFRTQTTGMRRFARIGIAGLGLMWLGSAVTVAITRDAPSNRLLPFVWLLLGVAITWKYIVQPWLVRVEIRTQNPSAQVLTVRFGDDGVDVEAEGLGQFHRPWQDLVGLLPASKGVAFGFSDGLTHWLPNRVFKDQVEREALIAFLLEKMPPEPPAV